VIAPIIIVFSAVLFLLFEKPFMRPGWYLASRPGTKQAIP